jgi:23S rRNA (adenine-N6)-dimethyltransferase
VDGGLLRITRRADPLVEARERRSYQSFVHQVFTGRGRGMEQILRHLTSRDVAWKWLRANAVDPHALPRDLTAAQWTALFATVR